MIELACLLKELELGSLGTVNMVDLVKKLTLEGQLFSSAFCILVSAELSLGIKGFYYESLHKVRNND